MAYHNRLSRTTGTVSGCATIMPQGGFSDREIPA
jgi:hypothetical protein